MVLDYVIGEIKEIFPLEVSIENRGNGYRLFVSLFTRENLVKGQETKLYFHYQWINDAYILYGFSSSEERSFFHSLISVNGLGCRMAMRVLNQERYDKVVKYISSKEEKKLSSFAGIGSKMALKIILELSDKMSHFSTLAKLSEKDSFLLEAAEALENLGFDRRKIDTVFSEIEKTDSQEEFMKNALQKLRK